MVAVEAEVVLVVAGEVVVEPVAAGPLGAGPEAEAEFVFEVEVEAGEGLEAAGAGLGPEPEVMVEVKVGWVVELVVEIGVAGFAPWV